jgi:hypothetical protein
MRLLLLGIFMFGFVGLADAETKRKHKPKPPSEIIEGLWQGPRLPHGTYDWDVIVFGADEWQPKAKFYPGAQTVYAHLSDIPKPAAKTWGEAVAAAYEVAYALHVGKAVLVTCGQGYNRSGLINALAMIILGYDTEEAIAIIRKQRGPSALRNKTFLKFIRAFVPEELPDIE